MSNNHHPTDSSLKQRRWQNESVHYSSLQLKNITRAAMPPVLLSYPLLPALPPFYLIHKDSWFIKGDNSSFWTESSRFYSIKSTLRMRYVSSRWILTRGYSEVSSGQETMPSSQTFCMLWKRHRTRNRRSAAANIIVLSLCVGMLVTLSRDVSCIEMISRPISRRRVGSSSNIWRSIAATLNISGKAKAT